MSICLTPIAPILTAVAQEVPCPYQMRLNVDVVHSGVAFKRSFTYAGAEQRPKPLKDPLILSLNVELELKAEKDSRCGAWLDPVPDHKVVVDADPSRFHRRPGQVPCTSRMWIE